MAKSWQEPSKNFFFCKVNQTNLTVLQEEIQRLEARATARAADKQSGLASKRNKEDVDKQLKDLENVYRSLYKFYRKMPRRSSAAERLEATERRLIETLPARKQEYEKLKKQHDQIMNDPKLKEQSETLKLFFCNSFSHLFTFTVAEIEALKMEVNQEKLRVEALDKELDEISAQIATKERNKQKQLEEDNQKLAEIDRKIAEAELYLANNDEELLEAKITKLETQLSKLQASSDDEFSSEPSLSGSAEVAPASPVFEKLTTDLFSFFKNPNDFAIVSPSIKQSKNQKAGPSGKPSTSSSFESGPPKKDRVLSSRPITRSSIPNNKLKSPVTVLTKSSAQQKLAKPIASLSTPAAPPPIVVSPLSEEKQGNHKILQIEILPQLPAIDQAISEESSEPEKISCVPRSLNKEFESSKEPVVKESVSDNNLSFLAMEVDLDEKDQDLVFDGGNATGIDSTVNEMNDEELFYDDLLFVDDELFCEGETTRNGSFTLDFDAVNDNPNISGLESPEKGTNDEDFFDFGSPPSKKNKNENVADDALF